MGDIKKEYYPYPGNQIYYQPTTNPFNNIPKPVHDEEYTKKEIDKIVAYIMGKIHSSGAVITEEVTFETLPEPSEENSGVIFNISDGFISDDRFVDGAGKHYSAGCNAVVVNKDGVYKFDVLTGEIGSATEESIEDIIDDLYKD